HLICFFFSSRRRHTRSKRDWSSDVCSSDLDLTRVQIKSARVVTTREQRIADGPQLHSLLERFLGLGHALLEQVVELLRRHLPGKIGRASCRERVEMEVVGG